jgi:hypothetical protein
MKFNKWTVGLTAVGAVSLASVVQAADPVAMAASSTTISGYVDTSMQWNIGKGDSHAPAYKYGGAAKADGFNLDVVKVTLEKPLDESEWAAGYKVDLLMGPDAVTFGSAPLGSPNSDFAIKQAYVALRAPIGNGLDIKIGVFDSIIGYESTEAVNNPNFTRSWGHTFEPAEHTGILATYRVCNMLAISGGVADTSSPFFPAINARNTPVSTTGVANVNESSKTYMAAIAVTAPDNWGFLSSSSAEGGFVEGFDNAINRQNQNYYAGVTLATPVTGVKVGASFDYFKTGGSAGAPGVGGFGGPAPAGFPASATFNARSFAGYIHFDASEKLKLDGRFEYVNASPYATSVLDAAGFGVASRMASTTGTITYDLWKNVLSRVEFRWDHALDGSASFGGTSTTPGFIGHGTMQNSYILAANVIYKF